MNKNAIKKFATEARRELIARVRQRALKYGISEKEIGNPEEDTINGHLLSPVERKQRAALIEEIREKGYTQVIEEVAYTWFNRFSALRFMEVNGYLPSKVRVFTDEANAFKPQILTEAIHLELDGLDMEKVYAYKEANDNDELYKYLLITQCNALNSVLPGMFQKIADYTELLFPDNLLREGSVIQMMIELIPEDDWKDQVQILGWLYQYYNSDLKSEVDDKVSKSGKVKKEEIPAKTQLFTPDWIVRYMVENSLGRLWLEGHPDTKTQLLPSEEEQSAYAAGSRNPEDRKWHYYLEEAKQEPEVEQQLATIRKEYAALTPEQLKVIDPCMGSGHILVYMFDVLMQIYASYGYTTRDAVASIVEHNLYGLDIDDRATQLAYFAVMMKARQYDRRFFSRGIQPHVYAIAESNHVDSFSVEYFCKGDAKLTAAMDTILKELHDAKEYGSILTVTPQDWPMLYERFTEITEDIHMSRETALRELLPLVQVAEALAQKYDVVVTNPPYMKADNMSPKLAGYVEKYKSIAKYDLYAAFIYRCHELIKSKGFMSIITMHNYMFAPSFLEMRNEIKNWSWVNMVHLGSRAFSEISGEVVQTVACTLSKRTIETLFPVVDVTEEKTANGKETKFLKRKHSPYIFNLQNLDYIPGHAFGYSLSDVVINLYKENAFLNKHGISKAGVVTGADDIFVKYWFEVLKDDITFNPTPNNLYKYVPFSKGGTFNKWYGNSQNILSLIDMWDDTKTNKSVRRGDRDFYYRRGIGWSQMGGGVNKAFSEIVNAVCKTTTPMFYVNKPEEYNYILGFLNSKIPPRILKSLNPTLSILTSDIVNLPFLFDKKHVDAINSLVEECITISKKHYSEKEENWQFTENCLMINQNSISDSYRLWREEIESDFIILRENETKLNNIFVNIMGLRDEISSESEDYALPNEREVVARFISYAVGCMFGRYSLDVEGLAYAGGEWDPGKYASFPADKDNILPICDDEYFEDDIVGRFVEFVKTVYGAETLDENLRFIADALGGKGQPKEVIRNYFLNDFYADHCRIYQKRPIYWLFDSGKKNGFKSLIYMHRYRPDTIARIRTDYVHEQQARYRTALADLATRIANASTGERVKLTKQLKKLSDQAAELHVYEEKIHHLADQMISIDLDDGVKVNYAKFQDVLAKIK